MSTSPVTVEVSIGELIDKMTILEIKAERLTDPKKVANVMVELEILRRAQERVASELPGFEDLRDKLKRVNGRLWDIEDQIRDYDRRGEFGQSFVDLARSVYRSNDERAALKRQINEMAGSRIVEEKSYTAY